MELTIIGDFKMLVDFSKRFVFLSKMLLILFFISFSIKICADDTNNPKTKELKKVLYKNSNISNDDAIKEINVISRDIWRVAPLKIKTTTKSVEIEIEANDEQHLFLKKFIEKLNIKEGEEFKSETEIIESNKNVVYMVKTKNIPLPELVRTIHGVSQFIWKENKTNLYACSKGSFMVIYADKIQIDFLINFINKIESNKITPLNEILEININEKEYGLIFYNTKNINFGDLMIKTIKKSSEKKYLSKDYSREDSFVSFIPIKSMNGIVCG
jgi:hypothetical protein